MATPIDWSTPAPFASAREDRIDTSGDDGMMCEIKIYEIHYNSKGEKITLQAETRRKESRVEGRDFNSALVVKKHYSKDKSLESTELIVRSPHLKLALRSVIGTYPGITFDSNDIVLRDTPQCLFHYRQELKDYGSQLQDSTAVKHLTFLLKHMYSTLETELKSYYNLMESPQVEPGIEFNHLWMIFRPGDLIFTREDDADVIFQCREVTRGGAHSCVKGRRIRCKGEFYGRYEDNVSISSYDGYAPLSRLKCYPLRFHPQQAEIKKKVLARARKLMSLQGVHHCSYRALASRIVPIGWSDEDNHETDDEDETDDRKDQIRGRIVIDAKRFYERTQPLEKRHIVTSMFKPFPDPTEDELLICSHRIPGFSLTDKRWYLFNVDDVEDVKYDNGAFDNVLLPARFKNMIAALADAQNFNTMAHSEGQNQDTVMQKNGRGTVMLFYGAYGVGKTLTAESIAETTQRPLYVLSGTDLGSSVASTEIKLMQAFELAARWKAVLLLDEADMFLEKRRSNQPERNTLVSVILRLIENHQGIIILATNHVNVLDPALRSRINLAVKYPQLDFTSRLSLWRTFLADELGEPHTHSWLTDSHLAILAKAELNGRNIRNVVRTAKALAAGCSRAMEPEDIQSSLDMVRDFEQEFADEDFTQEPTGYGRKRLSSNGDDDASHRSRKRRAVLTSKLNLIDADEIRHMNSNDLG